MRTRILGIVGWVGTILVFAAVAVRFLKPDWDRYAYWAAWVGLACVLVYTMGQWRDIARAFSRRQARYGTLALSSIVIVLGILVAINYLSARRSKRWDLTAGGQFTLSEQTKKLLRSLDAPLKMIVFERETDFDRFRQKLPEYQHESRQVEVQYVDPDKQPAQSKQYQVQSYGTIVLVYKGRTERVVSDQEQEIANGLIKVMTGQERKIYLVQGHGERDTTSSDRDGYSALSSSLKGENYTVEKLVLAQQPEVPLDATVVIVAGPKTDYFLPEVDALRRYLRKGGKLLVMLDPPDKPGADAFPNLTALLKEWAIDPGANVVVDVSGVGRLFGADASVPVAANYPYHQITQQFSLITAFPLARSMSPLAGVEGRTAQTFVETSQRSWAETDIKELLTSGKVALDPAKGDKQGPISIGVALSVEAPDQTAPAGGNAKPADAKKPETRLVAFGDSDFASNMMLGVQGNRDLFMNVINWLAQQETLISIRPKEPEDRRITLTADQQQRIRWLSIVVLPGAVMAAGVYVWWRRR